MSTVPEGALLKAEDLSVLIDRGKNTFNAVDHISFSLESGEITGIAGESGCGKSLTALSLMGLLSEGIRADGRIIFGGEDLLQKTEQELCRIRGKDISMIFQESEASLNPLMKIGAQIGEALSLHGEKDRNRVRKETLSIMEELKLPEAEKLAAAYPHQLSGGMCQRVMIALAMINRPRLLIADEATTALDRSTQTQILELLKRLNAQTGTAILFISHDLSVIRELCSRVLIMYGGRIVESGPVETVFSRAQHPYTRGLLGAIPGKAKKGTALASIPGRVPPVEELINGCRFAPRCTIAQECCGKTFPAGVLHDNDHTVYCWGCHD